MDSVQESCVWLVADQQQGVHRQDVVCAAAVQRVRVAEEEAAEERRLDPSQTSPGSRSSPSATRTSWRDGATAFRSSWTSGFFLLLPSMVGLQNLDVEMRCRVVNMTVCLSDSQLHLFLQTQLPVGHILDCVQGHTPYTVTDAILTYASSNRGWAQAQEEDGVKEPGLSVSYESMESPAPHQPHPHKDASRQEVDPLADILEPRHATGRKCRKAILPNGRQDDVDEDGEPAEATFYLGGGLDIHTTEDTPLRSGPMETPVEVHSPAEDGAILEEEPTASEGRMERQSSEEVHSTAPRDSEEERVDVVSACDNVKLYDPAKEERHEDEHRQEVRSEEEDSSLLSSSNESIVKVSDEEDISDEEHVDDDATADLIPPPNGFVKMCSPEDPHPWSPVSGGTTLELHVNGCADEDELRDSSENNDFKVLESSDVPELGSRRHSGQEMASSLPAHAADETAEDI
uniref:sorting nexin-11 isoform X2 n=1 Tax=Doryrhamphus excisus TaxID=161450 RepID=UPI0025ADE03D|nr:sorting nexin-11 isoform X2 [Doryrhamphus excisus]